MTGDWQLRLRGRRLRLAVAWNTYAAPLLCVLAGHRPARYSALPDYALLRICSRCRRPL